VDAPAEDAPAALVDELDDEHAAVTPTSNAAAAPAAGTDKDRFIPAPSREFLGSAAGPPSKAQCAPRVGVRGLACCLPPNGMFSCWQPRGNICVDRAAGMSPMSRRSAF